MIAADRANASFIPRIAWAGPQSETIQRRGDLVVGKSARHSTQDLDRAKVSAAVVPAGNVFLHAQFGVAPAGPMNQQHDFSRGLIHIGDDLFDQNAYDSLLEPQVRCWRVPHGWKVLCQAAQGRFVRNPSGIGWQLVVAQSLLYLSHTGQRGVPTRFEFRRHATVFRIASFISPSCKTCFIAWLPQAVQAGAVGTGSIDPFSARIPT